MDTQNYDIKIQDHATLQDIIKLLNALGKQTALTTQEVYDLYAIPNLFITLSQNQNKE